MSSGYQLGLFALALFAALGFFRSILSAFDHFALPKAAHYGGLFLNVAVLGYLVYLDFKIVNGTYPDSTVSAFISLVAPIDVLTISVPIVGFVAEYWRLKHAAAANIAGYLS